MERWNTAFPPRADDPLELEAALVRRREELLSHPERIPAMRQTLGSLSAFMKHLKQPIAWRANREDGCLGHFFESRFYSGALLSEEAVVAAMAYVDLNPVRAKIAKTLEECTDSSIAMRLAALANSPARLHDYLAPLVSGIQRTGARGADHPRSLLRSAQRLDCACPSNYRCTRSMVQPRRRLPQT